MKVISRHHLSEDEILSEQEQVTAAKRDPAKFETLYKKYYEPIFRFIYRRLNNKQTAFDVTQQVFLNSMLKLKKYESRGLPFSAWLYRIALNELNKLFRKNKNERTINVEIDTIGDIIQEMEESHDEDKIKIILRAMKELDENSLLLIEMRFFEKRSFREIGEIINCTENNAKVKVYRILDRMKKNVLNK